VQCRIMRSTESGRQGQEHAPGHASVGWGIMQSIPIATRSKPCEIRFRIVLAFRNAGQGTPVHRLLRDRARRRGSHAGSPVTVAERSAITIRRAHHQTSLRRVFGISRVSDRAAASRRTAFAKAYCVVVLWSRASGVSDKLVRRNVDPPWDSRAAACGPC